MYNQGYELQNVSSINEKKTDKFGVISLVLGIISIITSLTVVLSIPAGIVGLILGVKSKVKSSSGKIGTVLNVLGIVFTVLWIAFLILAYIVGSALPMDAYNTYSGDGFSLKYDDNWSISYLSNGNEALEYQGDFGLLIPVGRSALSDCGVDFSTTDGQNELYQMFYSYWDNEVKEKMGFEICDGSDGFEQLMDGVYYATYVYAASSNDIEGEYILLVSPEKNSLLSFMTNSDNPEENYKRSMEVLKSIEIEEIPESNVIYDDELYESMNDLSNWNLYSYLRAGDLGKNKSLNGGWRILSDAETYWEFENGIFRQYNSYNDLNDNYCFGTTEILVGKEGFSAIGMDENKIDTIIANNTVGLTEEDFYTVICTPTKLVLNGEDKSSDGFVKNYIWILIDHGDEGIEAQILNVSSNLTGYYVKVSD